jgi:hypothetical protein
MVGLAHFQLPPLSPHTSTAGEPALRNQGYVVRCQWISAVDHVDIRSRFRMNIKGPGLKLQYSIETSSDSSARFPVPMVQRTILIPMLCFDCSKH